MGVRPTRFLAAIAGSLLAVVIGASPVAAYKGLGATGTTGTHSLTDTRSSPGADCHYRFSNRGTAWELSRINVDPPNMEANAFQEGNQRVGWQFTVERRSADAFHEQPGPWEHRYTSPKEFAITDADHNAPFFAKGVRVRVPGSASADAWYDYRVIVEGFWYRDNGSVSGTTRLRVEWFKSSDGNAPNKQRLTCRSYFF